MAHCFEVVNKLTDWLDNNKIVINITIRAVKKKRTEGVRGQILGGSSGVNPAFTGSLLLLYYLSITLDLSQPPLDRQLFTNFLSHLFSTFLHLLAL